MTPEQAAFFVEMLLPQVQKEYLTTRRVLKAIPIAKESYRPHPDSRRPSNCLAYRLFRRLVSRRIPHRQI